MSLTTEQIAALPIGTPSMAALARNLSDLDRIVNATSGTILDRRNIERLTVAEALRRIGFETPVTFAAGISVSRATQTVVSGGLTYHANPASLPFTTTASFTAGQWMLVSNVTLQDLASTAAGKGASLIGVRDAAGLLTATTAEDALAELAQAKAAQAITLGSVLDSLNGHEMTLISHAGRLDALEAVQQSGTFTPTLTGFGESGTVSTSGRWVRNGKAVHWSITIDATAGGLSTLWGTSFVDGLPFTPAVSSACPVVFATGAQSAGALLTTAGRVQMPYFTAGAHVVTVSGVAIIS